MRPEQRWGIGIGLRYAHFPFAVPDQSATDLVPLLFYEGERVFLRGMEGGVGLFGNARWRLNAYMRYRFPDGPSTADEVRRDAWDIGPQLRYTFDDGLELRSELLSDGDGRTYLDVGVERRFGDDHARFEPYVGARIKSAAFNDWYFGLAREELGAGIDVRAHLQGRLHLAGNLFLIGRVGGYYLDHDARKSPLFEDDVGWEAFAGVAFFNDPGRRRKDAPAFSPYWRLAHGWATPSTLGQILTGDSEEDEFNNQLTSFFYGHPLSDELFGLPLDIYLTPGLVVHHGSDVQDRSFEYVIAIKAYYTAKWPVRLRFGVAEGFSYVRQVTYIERTNLEDKGNTPSRLLNYLDLSIDVNVGDLLGARPAKRLWLGYGIHHRSGIFESGSQFGDIRGGSNYNTVYLQWHF
ncbi:MipA/OmpV family protein [Sulfurifustis variabilis]|nr:MipA/OmpV family protein [Sulfurifustis variabilis]